MQDERGHKSTKYWHDKAEEARAMASQLHDPATRAVMNDIAVKYERMAERAAKRDADQAGGAARKTG